MNKALLALNVFLLLAVGTLYYLYFQYTNGDIHDKKSFEKKVADSFKIAYFDFDTLETYYEYSKEVRNTLMQLDSGNQAKLSAKTAEYNDEIRRYNQLSTPPTQLQQSEFEQKIQGLQNDYEKLRIDLAQQYQSASATQLQQVRGAVQSFLKEYCKERGYAYVLGTQEYDNVVYYKDTIRNITRDLIQKLNEKYRNERKK